MKPFTRSLRPIFVAVIVFVTALLSFTSTHAVAQSATQISTGMCTTGMEPSCQLPTSLPTGLLNPILLPREYTDETPEEKAPPQPPIKRPPAPTTEFEQMVADSVGRKLPIFGTSLFENVPTTFAPVSRIPVPANYVIGPGDEINVHLWGPIGLNARTTVDRNGEIYLPQIGTLSVAGIPYSRLEQQLNEDVGRMYKNFHLSATLGRLRTIQVFVVGEAANPGQYTVSSLSTLVNTIFASGGPTPHGSMRRIELRRGSQVVTTMDLYDLLVKGDKSKDVPVEPGDVIFYPPASDFVAVAGSVATPAIYELSGKETVAQALQTAGGPTVVADDQKISIERIDKSQTRTVFELSLDEAKSFPAEKADVIRILSLVPRFDNTVTLRGHVANPGRYPWKPGMTIRDLIPSAKDLITRKFLVHEVRLTTGRATEYPVEQPEARVEKPGTVTTQTDTQSGTEKPASENQTPLAGSPLNSPTSRQQSPQVPSNSNSTEGSQVVPNEASLVEDIRSSAPQINWGYALIQRMNPVTLATQLIPFDLEKAVIENDPGANLPLQSGDIVTIFSQDDVAVPQNRRTQFITIAGEVRAPGVYSILPGDTLSTVVERAGGLTRDAYLYGSQLSRVSVREQQQKSLDSFIALYAAQMQQTSAALAAGNPDQGAASQARMAAQQQIIASMRELRSSGRVILQIPPTADSTNAFPEFPLEDGDQLTIPHRPAVVNVIGAVYNQGSFVYKGKANLRTYFNLAGRGTPIADTHRMFVVRADGSVITSQGHSGVWGGSFEKYRPMPGDTVVVPSKLQIGMFQRNLQNWTQIFSQAALTAASLAVLAKQ